MTTSPQKIISYTVRDLQARCKALLVRHHDEGALDPGQLDGMRGPKTRASVTSLLALRGQNKEWELFDESGIHRVQWHWTAGTYEGLEYAKKHYNDVIDKDGNVYDGAWRAEAQARYNWRTGVGVSHTLNGNMGAVGMSCMGMAGSSSHPFHPGKYPITEKAVEAMLERTAHYCRAFDIPVSRWSTLSHAEVQPTLGIRQRGKWDISVLPWRMSKTDDPVKVGDILRKMLVEHL